MREPSSTGTKPSKKLESGFSSTRSTSLPDEPRFARRNQASTRNSKFGNRSGRPSRRFRLSAGTSSLRPTRGSLVLFFNKMMVHGEQGQFQAVGHAQLVENISEMVLHCLLGDRELFGNVLIGVPIDDGCDDVKFTGRQIVGALPAPLLRYRGEVPDDSHQVGNAFAAHPKLAFHHTTNALQEELSGGFLEDYAPHSVMQGVNNLFSLDGCRKQDHLDGFDGAAELPQRFESGNTRHGQVQQQDVGFKLVSHFDGLSTI